MLMTQSKYFLVTVTLAVLVAAASAPALAEENAKQAYDQAVPQEGLKKMSAVDKLIAMEEIRQLPLRYGRCISQKDWDCVRGVFTPDFYYRDGDRRVHGPEGFIEVMHDAGTYDRVDVVLHSDGHEIELLSPTTARGIAAADYTFYYPPGQSFPTTGHEAYGIVPGETLYTPTYCYQTYEKVDDKWKIKTSDHNSFNLKRDFWPYTVIMPKPHVPPDGVPPNKR